MKKEKYYPITMCGAFFTEDYLEMIRSVVANVDTDLEIVDFIRQYLQTGTDFSQYPSYMKEIVMIHNTDILYEEDGDDVGYYMGIPFFEVPDHFSVKRICIDIRSLLISAGVLDENIHPDAIRVFSKILKVTEEE